MIKSLGGELKKLFIILSLLLSFSLATVTDIHGNVYATVQIGDQLWMAENLRATSFNNNQNIENNCNDCQVYDNGAISDYGRLYNGYVVTDESEVCPENWHIPTDNEWNILIEFYGDSSNAGGYLKNQEANYWNSPNLVLGDNPLFDARAAGIWNRDSQ